MTKPLLAFVALIYLCVSGSYFSQDEYGMGIVFVAYALANIGLMLA